MTQITVTIPTAAGKAQYFKIEFSKADFFNVVDAVSKITTVADLKASNLWRVV